MSRHLALMSTTLIEEETPVLFLPLCEANRDLVIHPEEYASNVVFSVGALKLIDKAP